MTTERNWTAAGMAEGATILGLSEARMYKLKEDDLRFPTPVEPLKMGDVYDAADFHAYKAVREQTVNKGGRPKKTPAT